MLDGSAIVRSPRLALVVVGGVWFAVAVGVPSLLWAVAIVCAPGFLGAMVYFLLAIPLFVVHPLALALGPVIATTLLRKLYRVRGRPSLLETGSPAWLLATLAVFVPEILVLLSEKLTVTPAFAESAAEHLPFSVWLRSVALTESASWWQDLARTTAWSSLLAAHLIWLLVCAWHASRFALLDGDLWRTGRIRVASLLHGFDDAQVERAPRGELRVRAASPGDSAPRSWRVYALLKEARSG